MSEAQQMSVGPSLRCVVGTATPLLWEGSGLNRDFPKSSKGLFGFKQTRVSPYFVLIMHISQRNAMYAATPYSGYKGLSLLVTLS